MFESNWEYVTTMVWGVFFLDGYLGYHQNFIALEDKYNIVFDAN